MAILSLEGDIDNWSRPGWSGRMECGPASRHDHPQPGRDRLSARQSQANTDWEDLTKPGIGVVYPDPKTSGGPAGTSTRSTASASSATAGRIPTARPPRPAFANPGQRHHHGRLRPPEHGHFDRGTGDALVTYENELAPGEVDGRVPPYVIPPATLLIEGPAAVVELPSAIRTRQALEKKKKKKETDIHEHHDHDDQADTHHKLQDAREE